MLKVTKSRLVKMTISLLLFLILTLLYPLIKFKLYSIEKNGVLKKPMIVAHRGGAGLAPENTIAAFENAIKLGADFIELDLHVSEDNRLIVIHDSNISRTTNGDGEIKNLTLGQIKKYDAGSWFNKKFSSEKIPVLEEVIDILDENCKILIELKWPKEGIYENIVDNALKIIKEKKIEQRVIIQSFERKYLEQIIDNNPDIECHQLIFGESSIVPYYFDRNLKIGGFKPVKNITSINSFYLYLNKKTVEINSKNNLKTGVFTVNKTEDVLKVASMGADYIITDYPNLARKALD